MAIFLRGDAAFVRSLHSFPEPDYQNLSAAPFTTFMEWFRVGNFNHFTCDRAAGEFRKIPTIT